MTNTEERALDIAEERYGKEETMEFDAAGQMNIFIDGYTQGATDQRKIDIEKTIEWLDNLLDGRPFLPDGWQDELKIVMEED